MRPIEQRDYQQRIISKTCNAYLQEGHKSVLIESPTGSGKTIMGLSALKQIKQARPDMTFGWVAMRQKLLKQAQEENKRVGVADIRFVSMFDKNPPKCDLIVTDECLPHNVLVDVLDGGKPTKAQLGDVVTKGLGSHILSKGDGLEYQEITSRTPMGRKEIWEISFSTPEGIFVLPVTEEGRVFTGRGYLRPKDLWIGDEAVCLSAESSKYLYERCPARRSPTISGGATETQKRCPPVCLRLRPEGSVGSPRQKAQEIPVQPPPKAGTWNFSHQETRIYNTWDSAGRRQRSALEEQKGTRDWFGQSSDSAFNETPVGVRGLVEARAGLDNIGQHQDLREQGLRQGNSRLQYLQPSQIVQNCQGTLLAKQNGNARVPQQARSAVCGSMVDGRRIDHRISHAQLLCTRKSANPGIPSGEVLYPRKACLGQTHVPMHQISPAQCIKNVTAGRAIHAEMSVVQVRSLQDLTIRGRVTSVRRTGITTETYDLGVAKNHNFFADGILVHNCQHDAAATCAALHTLMGATWSLGLSVGGDSRVLIHNQHTDEYRLWRIDGFCKHLNAPEGEFRPTTGYSVRAFDGQNFVWRDLKAVLKHKVGQKQCFRIKTEFGRDLLVTEDHSVFRVISKDKRKRKKVAELECVRTDALKVGDYLLQEDSTGVFGAPEHSSPSLFYMPHFIKGTRWKIAGDFDIDRLIQAPRYKEPHKVRYMRKHGKYGSYLTCEEYRGDKEGLIYHDGPESWCRTHVPISAFAYLIGYYIGDGWVDGTRTNFAVAKKDTNAFLEKLSVLEPFFYLNPQKDPARGESYEIRIANKYLSDFFRTLVPGRAHTKSIPECVYNWSCENVRLLIQGILDSDGSFSRTRKRRDRYYIRTTSRALADNLIELLKRFGVVAGVSKSPPRKGGVFRGRQIVGKHSSYTVNFSAHALAGDNKGVLGRRKKFNQNFAGQPAKILSITPEKTKYVYDFSVDDDKWQTFVASGFLVHNTATPFRTDRVQLSYEKVIRDCGVRFLIEKGYLSPYHQYAIDEWSPKEIAKRFLACPERWGKSVIYFQNQELCHELEQLLRGGGASCAVMLGSTPNARKEEIFDGFDSGAIQVLINIYLLTEGFDAPDLRTAWVRDSGKLCTMQMAGRCLRKDPDDPSKVAQVVQSQNTPFPYARVAKARKEFVLAGDEWRSLEPGAHVDRLIDRVRSTVLNRPMEMPGYFSLATERTVSIQVGKNGLVKENKAKKSTDASREFLRGFRGRR